MSSKNKRPAVGGHKLPKSFSKSMPRNNKDEAFFKLSERRFNESFRKTLVGMAVVSLDGTLLEVNAAFSRMLGYSIGQLRGKTFQNITHKEDLKKSNALVKKLLRGEVDNFQMEKRYVHKKGNYIWAKLNLVLVKDQNGKPLHFIAHITDLTQNRIITESLKNEQEFLQTIYDTAQCIILTLDKKGRILDFNPYMEKISGWKIEEARGKDWFSNFLPRSARQRVKEVFKGSISNKRVRGNVDSMLTKDGRELMISWWDQEFRDREGKFKGVVSIGQDVTERFIYEAKIEANNRLLETVLDAIPDIVGVQKTDHTIVKYNAAGYSLFNTTPKKIVGKKCFQLIGRAKPCDMCATDLAIKSKKTEKCEKYISEIGRWIEASSTPVIDSYGNVELIVEVIRDITERRVTEESFKKYTSELELLNMRLRRTMNDLQEKEQRLLDTNESLKNTKFELEEALLNLDEQRIFLVMEKDRLTTVLNQMSEGVLVISSKKQIEMINDRAKEMLGFNPNDEIPEGYKKFFVLQLWKEIEESKNTIVHKELKLYRPKEIVIEVALAHLSKDEEGGFVAVLRDITALREIEKRKSDFMANVAHEVRSPMAPISDALDLVRTESAGQLNDKQKHFLDIVSSNIERLSKLVDELLDLSKMSAGRMELKKTEVDLNAIVNSVMSGVKPMADKKLISITCNNGFNGKVNCDPDKITQVLYNLLVNAVKFSGDGTHIEISSKRDGNLVSLSVRDEGPGMSKAETELLFDRYKQLSTSAGIKGTGLGLAISKAIIELHGGKIWVESAPQKGSTFTFSIPIE